MNGLSGKELRKRDICACLLLSLVVIWAGLKIAPYGGNGLLSLVNSLPTAFSDPCEITLCPESKRSVTLCLLAYITASLCYFSVRQTSRYGLEYGSAQWGTVEEMNKAIRQKVSFPLTQHVALGMDTHKHRRNLNVLVIGGSGAGKTRYLVLPSALENITGPEKNQYSMIFTDPKKEILSSLGGVLEANGYTVRVLDLINPEDSDCYNPFAYIRDEKDVLKLITNLIRNTTPRDSGAGKDPFWEKAETALLEALMFYLLYTAPPEQRNFGRIMDLLRQAEVDENDSSKKTPLDFMFETLKSRDPENIACKQYAIFKSAAGKTAASILVSCSVRLAAFNLEQIRNITSCDTMHLDRMGTDKMAVFAVIPDNDTSLNYLVGMMYTQIIQELYYQADFECHGPLKRHVRFLLDEFANVSVPEEFDKSLATMRSRNISATIILQNLAQLKQMFKDPGWETITGNCDTLLYLGGNERSTHEYISKSLGKETICYTSGNSTKGHSSSVSSNQHITGRELLTPEEVRMLDNRKAILFVRGFAPVLDDKYNIEKHPGYHLTHAGGAPVYVHRRKAGKGFFEFSDLYPSAKLPETCLLVFDPYKERKTDSCKHETKSDSKS